MIIENERRRSMVEEVKEGQRHAWLEVNRKKQESGGSCAQETREGRKRNSGGESGVKRENGRCRAAPLEGRGAPQV